MTDFAPARFQDSRRADKSGSVPDRRRLPPLPILAVACLVACLAAPLLRGQDAGALSTTLKAAAIAEQAGRYGQASSLYQQALSSPDLSTLAPAVAIEVRTRLATDDYLLHRYQESLRAIGPVTSGASGAAGVPAQAWLVLGLDQLELGQLPQAEISLRHTLTLNAASGTARLALGDVLARSDRMEDAARAYEDQTRRTPTQPDAWYKLGLAYAQLSSQVAKDYTQKHPDDPAGQQLAAEGLLDEGNEMGAAAALFKLLRRSPGQPQANADLGAALLELAYAKAAEDHFRRELAVDPDCPASELGLAETATLRADWKQAASALENLIHSHPQELTRLLELQPPGPLRDAWRKGQIQVPAPLKASAVGALWSAWLSGADTLPDIPAVAAGGGCATPFRKAETVPGFWISEPCYRRLRERLADKKTLTEQERLKLAEADFRLGRFDRARDEAERVLHSDAASGWAAYWLSQSYGMLAEDCYTRVTSQNPDSARVHEMLAHYWVARRYYPRAKNEYLAAIQLAPGLPDLHLGLANVYIAGSEWPEAQAELTRTLELAPGSTVAEYELGDVYVQQQRYDLAVEHLKPAVSDPAVGAKARLDLAEAESESGQTSQAIAELAPFAAADRDGLIHFKLAKLYRKLGDKQHEREALAAFRQLQSASLQPDEGELRALEQEPGATGPSGDAADGPQ